MKKFLKKVLPEWNISLYKYCAVKKPQDAKLSPLTSPAIKGKIVFIEFNLFEDCILLLLVLLHCKKSDTLGLY